MIRLVISPGRINSRKVPFSDLLPVLANFTNAMRSTLNCMRETVATNMKATGPATSNRGLIKSDMINDSPSNLRICYSSVSICSLVQQQIFALYSGFTSATLLLGETRFASSPVTASNRAGSPGVTPPRGARAVPDMPAPASANGPAGGQIVLGSLVPAGGGEFHCKLTLRLPQYPQVRYRTVPGISHVQNVPYPNVATILSRAKRGPTVLLRVRALAYCTSSRTIPPWPLGHTRTRCC